MSAKRLRRLRFIVTFPDVRGMHTYCNWRTGYAEKTERVTILDIQRFMCDALRQWGGQGAPGDPFWPTVRRRRAITVKRA